MLLPPEQLAAPTESLSEKMFIERSLTENKFWLRIMKGHALFLGDKWPSVRPKCLGFGPTDHAQTGEESVQQAKKRKTPSSGVRFEKF